MAVLDVDILSTIFPSLAIPGSDCGAGWTELAVLYTSTNRHSTLAWRPPFQPDSAYVKPGGHNVTPSSGGNARQYKQARAGICSGYG